MTPRECLIYFALKFNGDYRMIRNAIIDKEQPDIDFLPPTKFKALTILDDDYPEYFKSIMFAPIVIFYYGDISLIKDLDKNLAVVGARRPTAYGADVTRYLVKNIVKKGVNIVSGLARGIDAIAHQTAINYGGKTIAVLGSGIDFCYPPTNEELYEEIKKNHLVISEYPGSTEPQPTNFPFRNRLIALLSKTILITDAKYRSGTSITANYALQFNRNVCTVPHPIFDVSLCNQLIEEGASLILSKEDLFEVMNVNENEPIFEN